MDKHWWELYYALPEDEQYDIDMDLWEEFYEVNPANKREESRRRKELTKRKVLQMLERAKSKEERRWEIDKLIDEEMEKRK